MTAGSRLLAALLLLFLLRDSRALGQPHAACREQELSVAPPHRLRLPLQSPAFRKHRGLRGAQRSVAQRSIVRCQADVEVLSVPEDAVAYEDVPLGGIVTIVETDVPLTEPGQIEQLASPVCSGVFIAHDLVLSSAHCVYHQRQGAGDTPYWMFGQDGFSGSSGTYLYAIAGKVSEDDGEFEVYALRRACIPKSYIDAASEDATTTEGNDVAIFMTSRRFSGASSAIATLGREVQVDAQRDYLLAQYPSDVAGGERLVIDAARSAIVARPLRGGRFFSVGLASWAGSSGGPIIDVEESRMQGRPVVVAVLMSEGWKTCDSGIVPVAHSMRVPEMLLEETGGSEDDQDGQGDNGKGWGVELHTGGVQKWG